jgi:hypothetical protein
VLFDVGQETKDKMKTIFTCVFWALTTIGLLATNPIPKDSGVKWDFRGEAPKSLDFASTTMASLYACSTYEELRDALIKVIQKLDKREDEFTSVMGLHHCRMALVRTYYVLGDIRTGDRLMESFYGISNKVSSGARATGRDRYDVPLNSIDTPETESTKNAQQAAPSNR